MRGRATVRASADHIGYAWRWDRFRRALEAKDILPMAPVEVLFETVDDGLFVTIHFEHATALTNVHRYVVRWKSEIRLAHFKQLVPRKNAPMFICPENDEGVVLNVSHANVEVSRADVEILYRESLNPQQHREVRKR